MLMPFLLLLMPTPARAETPQTVVEDKAEAEKLLGKHLFADNALGDVLNYGYPWAFSMATISQSQGVYTLNAQMECYTMQNRNERKPRGGYTRIQGHILNIRKNQFSIKGELEFMYLPGTTWEDSKKRFCKREGVFHFTRVHASPEDIEKDFWYLDRPDSIAPNEHQKPDIDCLRYIYPLLIFTDRISEKPKQEFCAPYLKDFGKY